MTARTGARRCRRELAVIATRATGPCRIESGSGNRRFMTTGTIRHGLWMRREVGLLHRADLAGAVRITCKAGGGVMACCTRHRRGVHGRTTRHCISVDHLVTGLVRYRSGATSLRRQYPCLTGVGCQVREDRVTKNTIVIYRRRTKARRNVWFWRGRQRQHFACRSQLGAVVATVATPRGCGTRPGHLAVIDATRPATVIASCRRGRRKRCSVARHTIRRIERCNVVCRHLLRCRARIGIALIRPILTGAAPVAGLASRADPSGAVHHLAPRPNHVLVGCVGNRILVTHMARRSRRDVIWIGCRIGGVNHFTCSTENRAVIGVAGFATRCQRRRRIQRPIIVVVLSAYPLRARRGHGSVFPDSRRRQHRCGVTAFASCPRLGGQRHV